MGFLFPCALLLVLIMNRQLLFHWKNSLQKMLDGKKFIYCADAGLGSLNIRNFNAMGGRAFIVTQSIKKLSAILQQAVFNDTGYRLLSTDEPATIQDMKTFDKYMPGNKDLYNDRIYKIIPADKAFDLGLYEEKICKNGSVRRIRSKAVVPQKIIVSFSRKNDGVPALYTQPPD